MEFEKELYSDTIRRKRKRKQILPICENEDAEGCFENTFDPINEPELEENGFERSDEESEQEDDVVDENIPTSKRNKQNINKKSLQDESEKSRKVAKKQNKKDNDANSNNVEKTSKKICEKEGTEEKLWTLNKNNKLKSKKTKTKKLQNAINYFNKKLLNRSSDDTTPTKAKKSRQSVHAVWDISNNDDPPTPTMSPASKIFLEKSPSLEKSPTPTISPASKISLQQSPPLEKSVVIETKEIATISKEESKQIPWLHPVLTKLEDEKRVHKHLMNFSHPTIIFPFV